tara:strand:+ start:1945 stop:7941 length:5997 start_codon:yes stop_codon:yes gene_type:complete
MELEPTLNKESSPTDVELMDVDSVVSNKFLGPAPRDFVDPVIDLQDSKDEAFYAASVLALEEKGNPFEVFDKIQTELNTFGYSDTISQAKALAQSTEDKEAQKNITNLVEDISITNVKKKELLKNYIDTPTVPITLKGKYINDLTNNVILNSNVLPGDIEYNNAILTKETTILQQGVEKVKDIISNDVPAVTTPDLSLVDKALNNIFQSPITKMVLKGWNNKLSKQEDNLYIPLIDDIAMIASMGVHTPDYVGELTDTWKVGFGTPIIGYEKLPNSELDDITKPIYDEKGTVQVSQLKNPFKSNGTLMDESEFDMKQGAKTITELREEVYEFRKTSMTREMAMGFDEILNHGGVDVSKFSTVKLLLDGLGWGITKGSNFINKDDPGKHSLWMESLLLILLPKAMKIAKEKGKGAYRSAKQYGREKKWDDINAKKKAEDVLNPKEPIIDEVPKNPYTGNIDAPGLPRNMDNPSGTGPFATTNLIDRSTGLSLVQEMIYEPITVGSKNPKYLNYNELAVKMFDPLFNIFKTNDIGVMPDWNFIRQMRREQEISNQIALLNMADVHYEVKRQYLERQAKVHNEILYNQKVEQAGSLDLITNNGAGFDYGIAYRRSPTENFKTREEAMSVYEGVLQTIYKTLDPSELVKPKEGKLMTPLAEWNPKQYLEIHEVITNDPTFQPIAVYKNGFIPEVRPRLPGSVEVGPLQTSYIIRWGEVTSFTERYKHNLTETINDRYPYSFTKGNRTIGNLFQDVTGTIFPRLVYKLARGSSADGAGTGGMPGATGNWWSSFGALPRLLEVERVQTGLKVHQFGNSERNILLKNTLNKLSAKEQLEVSRILYHLENVQSDFISFKDLQQQVPVTMKTERIFAIQKAVQNYRMFVKQQYRYNNHAIRTELVESGFDRAFIVEDPATGIRRPQPVMEQFLVEADGKKVFQDGRFLITKVWDYDLGKSVDVYLKPEHMKLERQVWSFNRDTGLPEFQIYQMPNKWHEGHISTPEYNISYSYIAFRNRKSQLLPSTVLPYVEGIVPKINTDNMIIEALPLNIKVDGQRIELLSGKRLFEIDSLEYIKHREIEYKANTGKEYPIEQKKIDLKAYLKDYKFKEIDPVFDQTKPYIENRILSEVEKADYATLQAQMSQYGKVVGTHIRRESAELYIKSNLKDLQKQYPDHHFLIRKGSDLLPEVLRKHYETEATSSIAQTMRGNHIKYETATGPLETAIINSHKVGKKMFSDQMIKRMKVAFVEMYVTPKDKSVVTVEPNPRIINTVDRTGGFPTDVGKISKKGEFQAEYDQARIMYNNIRTYELGTPNKTLAGGYFNLLNTFIDRIETNPTFLKYLNKDAVIKRLRTSQKNSRDAVDILNKSITFLKITLSPANMALVQSPAAVMNLSIYGTTTQGKLGWNPVKAIANFKDAYRLMTVAVSKTFEMNYADKAVWDAALKYMIEEDMRGPREKAPSQSNRIGYDVPLSKERLEYLIKKGEEYGFFDLSGHEYNNGLFSQKIFELGDKSSTLRVDKPTSAGLLDGDINMKSPFSWVGQNWNKLTKASGEIFNKAEVLSRQGQLIAAVRNWEAKNPKKDWLGDGEAVNLIFSDADKLAGSMHAQNRYLWNTTTFGTTVGKFATYSMKQAEMLIHKDARIGTAKEAWAAGTGWAVLSGTGVLYTFDGLMWALENMSDYFHEDDDIRKYEKTWGSFSAVDEIVHAFREYGRPDGAPPLQKLKLGDKVGPYGNGDSMLGFHSNLANLISNTIFGTKENTGAGIQQLKQFFGPKGTLPILSTLYEEPTWSAAEKAVMTTRLLLDYIPFVKNINKGMQERLQMDISTKTGHLMGVGGEDSDFIWRNFFGLQTYTEQDVWDVMSEGTVLGQEQKKLISESASNALTLFFNKNGENPDYETTKNYADAWTASMKDRGFLQDDLQVYEWKYQFERLIERQRGDLIHKMADTLAEKTKLAAWYSTSRIQEFIKVTKALGRKYPEQKQIMDDRLNLMLEQIKKYNDQQKRK